MTTWCRTAIERQAPKTYTAVRDGFTLLVPTPPVPATTGVPPIPSY